ncbi:MAG: RNA polymerase sigma factor [Bacteroides xylanisolvens]
MEINEVQCIRELRNGSYQAFTQIYEAYADRLYGFVLKQLKNRSLAQDIVQDTFLRLWDNHERLDSMGNLQAFIFTIAKHQVIDYFRKQVNELQFEEFIGYCETQATDVSPEDILLYDEFLQQLKKSKGLLSQREREIYELSREKHIPIKQIAEQLNLSEQTVKNYLTSALKSLRSEIAKYSIFFIFFL